MGDGGKGDARRPGDIPDGAWERVFGYQKLCSACSKPINRCDCRPTEYGPGQDDEARKDEK